MVCVWYVYGISLPAAKQDNDSPPLGLGLFFLFLWFIQKICLPLQQEETNIKTKQKK